MKNTIKSYLFSAILCLSFLTIWACSADKDAADPAPVENTLTADTNKIDFLGKGNESIVKVTANVQAWTITSTNANWIQLSQTSGVKGTVIVKITALENTTKEARRA